MDELNLKTVYRIEGQSVVKYMIIGETDEQYIVVPDGIEMMAKKEQFFSKKFDAQYELVKKRLTDGVLFINYKKSPYYKQYYERLFIENPELLI